MNNIEKHLARAFKRLTDEHGVPNNFGLEELALECGHSVQAVAARLRVKLHGLNSLLAMDGLEACYVKPGLSQYGSYQHAYVIVTERDRIPGHPPAPVAHHNDQEAP